SYGPFRPGREGAEHFPSPEKTAQDFALMRAMGVNVIRVYHSPPAWLLDLAREHGLRALVTIPWHKRVLFLDDRRALAATRDAVRRAARAGAVHPAVMGYFVDNEIPPDLVRWYGARRIERFIDELAGIVKEEDAGALVSYANFPPTEYLLPANLDFYSYNVY